MAKQIDLKSKSCLCWDNGLFIHVAVKLAEEFGQVFYGTPYVNAFPKSNNTLPGDGLKDFGVTRIRDFDAYEDRVDLIVFPDVMFGALQERLVRQGKRVWGPGRGELLELDRWGTKKFLISLNMPVAESHLIRGMDALRRFLQQREGKWWIKTSRYRGDFETFDSEDYELSKPKLNEIEHRLGEKAAVYSFIVERDIPAITEVGYDGFNIRGQFANHALMGREEKDIGLIGVQKNYSELPPAVQWVNSKLADRLKNDRYQGFFSTEVRCTNDETFENPEGKQFEDFPMLWNKGEKVPGEDMYALLTDPCTRAASPPSELYIEWFSNWPEIIWAGADGLLIEPDPIAKYGVEIMLHSGWADSNWQAVKYPEEIFKWVKLRNMCILNGKTYAVPQGYNLPEIGAVVAVHDDLSECCRLALDRCSQVKGYFIEAKTEAIQKAITDIKNAQEHGIHFTDDPLPTPEMLEEIQPVE